MGTGEGGGNWPAREKMDLFKFHIGQVGSRIIFLFAPLCPKRLELALHGMGQPMDLPEPEGNVLFCL